MDYRDMEDVRISKVLSKDFSKLDKASLNFLKDIFKSINKETNLRDIHLQAKHMVIFLDCVK